MFTRGMIRAIRFYLPAASRPHAPSSRLARSTGTGRFLAGGSRSNESCGVIHSADRAMTRSPKLRK